jgi:membrane associated rhomboid family serine protease
MSITIILVIAIVGVSYYAWKKPELWDRMMLRPTVVQSENQYDRLLTSGFIHGDYFHLGLNAFVLWNFGEILEKAFYPYFGDPKFAGVHLTACFIIGVVVANIPVYIKYRNDPSYSALGASGGVSALVFSFITLAPTEQLSLFFFIEMPGIVLGVLYLAYSYYMGKKQMDNIGHEAHFYGAIFGVAYTLLFFPNAWNNFIYQISNWSVI